MPVLRQSHEPESHVWPRILAAVAGVDEAVKCHGVTYRTIQINKLERGGVDLHKDLGSTGAYGVPASPAEPLAF